MKRDQNDWTAAVGYSIRVILARANDEFLGKSMDPGIGMAFGYSEDAQMESEAIFHSKRLRNVFGNNNLYVDPNAEVRDGKTILDFAKGEVDIPGAAIITDIIQTMARPEQLVARAEQYRKQHPEISSPGCWGKIICALVFGAVKSTNSKKR